MRTRSICLAVVIVLLSPFASAQWRQIGLLNRVVDKIVVGSPGLYAVTSDSGSVYRSTNGGANWDQIVDSGASDIAVAPNGTVYLVIHFADSLSRSSNGGTSWSNVGLVAPPGNYPFALNVDVGPTGLVFCGFRLLITKGVNSSSFTTSRDGGLSWLLAGLDTLGGEAVAFRGHSVLTFGHIGGLGGYGAMLLLSSDDGLTWISRGGEPYTDYYFSNLAWSSNGNILAWGLRTHPAGLFLSVDTASTWTKVSSVNSSVLFALPHGGVLVGTDSTGIYLFSDNGDSIKTLSEGLTDLHVHTLAMDDTQYVYAGTNNGVWRRPLSQVVSVSHFLELPTVYRLGQNFPNPFNPSTTIQYELPKPSRVTLAVYDILGRQVSVLVNERRDAGVHEVKFDGANLASGVYFYRLQAGDFVQSMKLTMLK